MLLAFVLASLYDTNLIERIIDPSEPGYYYRQQNVDYPPAKSDVRDSLSPQQNPYSSGSYSNQNIPKNGQYFNYYAPAETINNIPTLTSTARPQAIHSAQSTLNDFEIKSTTVSSIKKITDTPDSSITDGTRKSLTDSINRVTSSVNTANPVSTPSVLLPEHSDNELTPSSFSFPSTNVPITTSSTSTRSRFTTVSPPIVVPNRIRGKPIIVCVDDGLEFEINTIFPFTGQIYAHEHKTVPECVFSFNSATTVKVKLSYEECGMKNPGQRSDQSKYHMQIVVAFEQQDTSQIDQQQQLYIAQCEQRKVQYQKSKIPWRIEEALEELEQKAPVPKCVMRILKDQEHSHDFDEGIEVNSVDLGQPMRIEWRLIPESDAYGFHVRNCTVQDRISGEEHLVIDSRGCSTDINIFGHPHYDTYHDVASVHWHAFKVPDESQLNIRCSFEICSDIADSKSGISSCESIPSPPYCPDVIASPANSVLSSLSKNSLRKRRSDHRQPLQQSVHADICIGHENDAYCSSSAYVANRNRHLNDVATETQRVCVSKIWLSVCTGLSTWSLSLAVGIYVYCRWFRKKSTFYRFCENLLFFNCLNLI